MIGPMLGPRTIEHPEDLHQYQQHPYWNTPDHDEVDRQVAYDEGADITDGATDEEK